MKQHYYAQHARNVQAELDAHLSRDVKRELHHKQAWRHGLLALRQFTLFAACAVGTIATSHSWFWIPFAVLQGLTIFNFTVLLHEVLHHGIFNQSRPRFERFLAQLYAIFCGISPTQFTRWHLDHHAELGSMDDPKRHHLSPKRNKRWLKLLYATPCLFIIYFRAAAKETSTYEPGVQQRIRRERLLAMSAHLTVATLIVLNSDIELLLQLQLIPVFFIFPIAFALNRLGQHYAIDPSDPAQWSTYLRSHPIWNWVFIYSNLHMEHHYYPGVPCYNLPKLQAHLSHFYAKKNMQPMTYGRLIRGWIWDNRAPHSYWAVSSDLPRVD